MTAQRGRDLLLKIRQGAGFASVAGLRSRRLVFNAETVDITDSQSAGRWRELLAGAAPRRVSLSGQGIFRDAATDALIRQTFFDDGLLDWQVIIPAFGTVTGPFQIVTLDYAARHAGEVTFSLALESAGVMTFAAIGGNA